MLRPGDQHYQFLLFFIKIHKLHCKFGARLAFLFDKIEWITTFPLVAIEVVRIMR